MKSGCEKKSSPQAPARELPILPNGGAESGAIAESRTAFWRALVLIGLNALMLIHIAQWLITGSTISPIEPSESMYTLQRGTVNAGFIFFVAAIASTLIFGRYVCGWGCHVVALQDLCGWLLKKLGLKPKPFRSRLLVWVPLIFALYMFVWPTVYWGLVKPEAAPLIPQFSNHLIVEDFWSTFPPIAVVIPFLFVCGFMTVYFLGQKGFCTYACPYGGFFSIADRLSPGKIRVTDACNQCGHCTAVCTSNVLIHQEVKEHRAIVDPGCMKCMDCVSVCPNDALYFGFGKPSLFAKPAARKGYSLSWTEDLVSAVAFTVALFAVWDVYQLVPMLMALGIASVSAYIVFRLVRLFTTGDSAFYNYALRSSGKMRRAGWIFIAFSIAWLGLVGHSGFIRYHERAGAIAYESVRIPDELALARPKPDSWLSSNDRQNVASGRAHLQRAFSAGLFTNDPALSKLAWLEYLSGNNDQAIDLLGKVASRTTGQSRAIALYYKGAIENRLGRYEAASEDLDRVIAESPGLILASEERGETLWQTGKKDEAVAQWKDALGRNQGLVVSTLFLAGAAAASGDNNSAAEYERRAAQMTPADPFFNWMLGLRLQNLGMNALADKHFKRATEIDPQFRYRRSYEGK